NFIGVGGVRRREIPRPPGNVGEAEFIYIPNESRNVLAQKFQEFSDIKTVKPRIPRYFSLIDSIKVCLAGPPLRHCREMRPSIGRDRVEKQLASSCLSLEIEGCQGWKNMEIKAAQPASSEKIVNGGWKR